MRALAKTGWGKGNLAIQDIPEPQVGNGQVMIEVKAVGICGTDLHIFADEFKVNPPVTLGHEVAGIVVETGKDVSGIDIGERVVTETHFRTCGLCEYCRSGHKNLCHERLGIGAHVNGGMAKYVVIPSKNTHKIPEKVSFIDATLIEPLACVIHSTCDLIQIIPGDLAVISGPGPIGLLALQVLKLAGATVAIIGTEKDEKRLKIARNLGAEHSINLARDDADQIIRHISNGSGANMVFECAGADRSAQMCLRLVRKGGQYIQIGLIGQPVVFDLDQLVYKEISVKGGFASVPNNWPRALKLVESRRIETSPLISHVFPLSEWEKAFNIANERSGLKIVLSPMD